MNNINEIYTTGIIYKSAHPCYSNREKKKKQIIISQKGKDMKAVRFAYYLNSERQYESLLAAERKEWSSFVRSYKVKQSIIV